MRFTMAFNSQAFLFLRRLGGIDLCDPPGCVCARNIKSRPTNDRHLLLRSEDQIVEGLRHLVWTEKMLVEGSAGLAQAAWQVDTSNHKGKISAVILCGANFDQD